MRLARMQTQTLEALRVREHLAPLCRQGGQPSSALVLSGHTDLKDLLGVLPSRHPAKGRQAQGDARGILGLAHPVLLGPPEKRCDRIGTDRQSDVIEPEGLGGLELVRQRSGKLQAQCGRGYGVDQWLTLGQGGMGEAVGFEHLLAGKQSTRIALKSLDQGLTGGQVIQAGAQCGEDRAALGTARW